MKQWKSEIGIFLSVYYTPLIYFESHTRSSFHGRYKQFPLKDVFHHPSRPPNNISRTVQHYNTNIHEQNAEFLFELPSEYREIKAIEAVLFRN
jgi:hypothetical protein